MTQLTPAAGPAPRRYLQPYGPVPAPVWYFGLDLGQRQDHSALAILHLLWTPLGRCAATYQYLFTPGLTVRSIERYPLNTSYEEIPRIIAARAGQINDRHRADNPRANAPIKRIVGPGGPMVDHLRLVAPDNAAIAPVMITAGDCLHCPAVLPGFPNNLSVRGYQWQPRRSHRGRAASLRGRRRSRSRSPLTSHTQRRESIP